MRTKRNRPGAKRGGFNFIDLLIVLVAVLLFTFVAVPFLVRQKVPRKALLINCVNNLKQVGLSFRIWANDNNGKFPMALSVNQGGTLEYLESGQVYRHFMAMSNVLLSPKHLTCPEDTRRIPAKDWFSGFNNQNISYFVGLEADEKKPNTILSGDRNITGGVMTNGNLMVCRSNTVLTWTTAIHIQNGNIGLGDGSVQQLSAPALQKQLQAEFQSVTNEVIRLAIP